VAGAEGLFTRSGWTGRSAFASERKRDLLERQEHNAMDGGHEVLVNAIIEFAATKE
jgi:hypothetical protein